MLHILHVLKEFYEMAKLNEKTKYKIYINYCIFNNFRATVDIFLC